ncbi:MAG: hypothetical protein KAS17_10785 [Victivallaceae bacterium]|nr:hypothetical protein [Victivallaceae bacterium]
MPILLLPWINPVHAQENTSLNMTVKKLSKIHTKLGKPAPREWLSVHDEPGQTFVEYKLCRPRLPTGKRKIIYIQPLGDINPAQEKIIKATAEFIGCYYNLSVKIKKPLPLSIIPKSARRRHPSWGMKQILTTYVLSNVLFPRLPDDAAVYIALTTSDLWPGKGWNFVFGQASLKRRVGVFSLYRNGTPEKSESDFLLCLRRTLKTCTHETGHMFSMRHCTAYECNMCGSNSREESDKRPLWMCPECLAKICWATKTDPIQRFKKLMSFYENNGLKKEVEFYNKSIKTINE